MMSRFSISWIAVSAWLAITATASSQSLVELAQKEKARRAEIAKTRESVEVIDAHRLTTVYSDTFTAIEVTGSLQPESPAEPAELGRPPLENPNRTIEIPTTQSSTTGNGAVAMGRGWSPGSEHPPGGRGWSTASEYPPGGRGWTRGGENPPDGRGWSDRSAADRGYSTGGDHSTSGRGWTRGGENPPSGRGWSQRPSNR